MPLERQVLFAFALFLLMIHPLLASTAAVEDYYPTGGWRTSSPEDQGMSSEKLQEINDRIKISDMDIDGVVVVRHGYLVWETYPDYTYGPTDTHLLYSVTKSFTSCLVGIAIERGYIEGVNQKMVSFFPDRTIANLDDDKEKITIENLLMMRSGLRWDESSAPFTDPRNDIYHILHGDGLQWCLDLEIAGKPGVTWHYNTGASHILSGIITEATGESTLRFAEDNLFRPLGITRYVWSVDGAGTTIGGFDLRLSPRDMAKFGYLYLHGGLWDGEQIVSQEWVEHSTDTLTKPYPDLGYGYQWWTTPSLNMFSARGLYNQMIYVLPDQDIVVAVTADMKSGGTDDLITDYVLASITESTRITDASAQDPSISGYPVEAVAIGLISITTVSLLLRRKMHPSRIPGLY